MGIAMKRRIFFIIFFILLLSRPVATPQAACVIGGGKSVSATVSFQSLGDEGSNLTVNGKSFFRNKPQCTSPQPSRSYTISCDEETETLAADSLFAPLCGSSEERGKTNSTCWSCGGTVKCDGLDWAVGSTDPFFSQIHNPVSPGDTNMDQVWRIPNASIPNNGYTYNGQHYDKPGGDLIACGSNNLACGSSEECTNIKHPDVNNRGRSGQEQCTAYSYTRLSLTPGSSSGTTGTVSSGGDKACINIGDYSSHFNELSKAAETFPNGWIYILALPEWMDSISAFIKDHPSNNFMIRLHSPSAELSPDYANRWVTNLKTNAGNITNKVYLMPVNEPNNSGDRRVEPNDARLFTSALSQGLDNEGLLNTKYIVTSPMIDPTSSDVTGWLRDFCADGYCNQFAAVAVAPYDFTGDMSDIKAFFPPGAPMIVAETGIKRNGQVVYGNDSETAAFLDSVKNTWGKSAIAACMFSYDPDHNTNPEWIYSATNTLTALRGLGQSIKPIAAPQVIQPKTDRSTISYESCTDTGAPDITSKVRIPNLITFGESGINKDKKSFFSGFKSLLPRPIQGFLGFVDNKLDEPSLFASFGRQSERAMPYLTPARINVQPIVQEYTHTVSSVLCLYDTDNNVTKAFPKKQIIQVAAPGVNKVLQNGLMLSGLLAPNVSVEKPVYERLGERYPNVLGKIDTSPECDEPPLARSVRKVQATTTDPEEYEVPTDKSPIYNIFKFFSSTPAIGLLCSVVDCKLDADPNLYALEKLKTPYIDKINLALANDQTGKPVGALPTFVPASFVFGNEHGKVLGQKIKQTIGSNANDLSADINFKYAKNLENYIDFTNCAISPGALQKNLDHSCNFSENDVTSDRPLDGGTDPNFSGASLGSDYSTLTNGKIPACVLEAVKYIETGTNTNFSGSCTVNACSAAGPFQVTTGAAPAPGGGWDTHCKQCGASWADGSRTCPDGWPGNWPQTASDPSPCSDVSAAADRAVEMLQEKARIRCETLDNKPANEQREAIITAGDSYYGSSENIPRLGNCSYGEFVYKHCDGSYECGTHKIDLGKKYEQCQQQQNL